MYILICVYLWIYTRLICMYACICMHTHLPTYAHAHAHAHTYGAGKAHSASSVNLKATEADAIGE